MAAINRFTNIDQSQNAYTPRSFEELLKPAAFMRGKHDELLASKAAYDKQIAELDSLGVHDELYQQERAMLDEKLSNITGQLNQEGFSQTAKSNFLDFNKQYQSAVGPKGQLGKMKTAKEVFDTNKQNFLAAAEKDGQSRERAIKNWNKFSSTYTGLDSEGNIQNIEELGSVKYVDPVKYANDRFKNVTGSTLTDVSKDLGTGHLYYQNGMLMEAETKGYNKKYNNLKALQAALQNLELEFKSGDTEIGKSLDFNEVKRGDAWNLVENQWKEFYKQSDETASGKTYKVLDKPSTTSGKDDPNAGVGMVSTHGSSSKLNDIGIDITISSINDIQTSLDNKSQSINPQDRRTAAKGKKALDRAVKLADYIPGENGTSKLSPTREAFEGSSSEIQGVYSAYEEEHNKVIEFKNQNNNAPVEGLYSDIFLRPNSQPVAALPPSTNNLLKITDKNGDISNAEYRENEGRYVIPINSAEGAVVIKKEDFDKFRKHAKIVRLRDDLIKSNFEKQRQESRLFNRQTSGSTKETNDYNSALNETLKRYTTDSTPAYSVEKVNRDEDGYEIEEDFNLKTDDTDQSVLKAINNALANSKESNLKFEGFKKDIGNGLPGFQVLIDIPGKDGTASSMRVVIPLQNTEGGGYRDRDIEMLNVIKNHTGAEGKAFAASLEDKVTYQDVSGNDEINSFPESEQIKNHFSKGTAGKMLKSKLKPNEKLGITYSNTGDGYSYQLTKGVVNEEGVKEAKAITWADVVPESVITSNDTRAVMDSLYMASPVLAAKFLGEVKKNLQIPPGVSFASAGISEDDIDNQLKNILGTGNGYGEGATPILASNYTDLMNLFSK